MKKLLIVVCSYNSKEYTRKIYEELKDINKIDLLILDNSDIDEEITDFGNCIHIGYENVEYGGMHDYILNSEYMQKYEFIGIFNNDIFGFTKNHFDILEKYLTENNGYISFSISPEFDKMSGVMHNLPNSNFRETQFIENVAPIYNVKLLNELKKYIPIHKYALIDFFMSKRSLEIGLKNILIDEAFFHHMRSGTRKKTNTFERYQREYKMEEINWTRKYPELSKYFI